MDNIPAGAIPVDQFQAAPEASIPQSGIPEGAIPVDQFESQEDKYGTPGQQAIAGLEGIGKGVIGPVAPALEKAFGVDPEAIRGREEANPWTHGIGQGVGLVAPAILTMGASAEAKALAGMATLPGIMGKAGTAAQLMTGLGAAEAGASLGFKIGAAAVGQAAEMAVFQGSDEVAKMVLNDPTASAESAIANVGLAAALGAGLGGAGSAAWNGAVSPLWKATAGPKVEQALSSFKDYLEGGKLLLPEQIENATKELGIEVSGATKAAMSGNAKYAQAFNELREAQNPSVIADLKNINQMTSESVMKSLKLDPADIEVYSENEAGKDLKNAFLKEYKDKYGPVSDALEKRNAEAVHISVPDDAKLDLYGKMLERGMAKVGTDSPAYKLYSEYGNRLLAKDTIGQMDMLKTEIYNSAKSLVKDNNEKMALHDIGSMIKDFQESQIDRAASKGLTKSAFEKSGADIIAERQAANQGYAKFSQMSDDLSKHIGMGEFRGYKSLIDKMSDKKSAEQLLNAFSPKGDADLIPFLKEHFPETLEHVRQNELKKILKPAILSAKDEMPVNIKKLNDIIEKGLAGQKEYIDFALPKGALEKIQAAGTLTNAIPAMKSSGTAGWMSKLYSKMPASVMASVAWLTGHGPLAGLVGGHFAQVLGRDAPDAIKLALLRFVAADQPIKSEGFKAMVDFLHATYKGENAIAKASANVLRPGVQVISTSQMPTKVDIMKLDKMVAKIQARPEILMQSAQNDHVGHYMPKQQTALTQTTAQAIKYLDTLKPQPYQASPLDKPVEPSPIAVARYHRALTIAQEPMVVLQHVKDGTVQVNDLVDLKSMYPAVYQKMAQNLTNEISNAQANDVPIPYHTKIGMSLFLGQPLDSSMTPASIMAAQPKPKPLQPMQGPKKQGSPSKMGKNIKSYQTPDQASASRRVNHD